LRTKGIFFPNGQEGFKKVFETFYPRLLRFANAYVGDRFEAENILQDVFLKLWEKWEALPPDMNLQAYLLTMVKNQCMDFLRHRQVVEQNTIGLETAHFHEASFNYHAISRFDPELMDIEALERLVEKAIDNLPGQCRKVFEYSRYDGLKYKEIAGRMGISVKTVETHISHALKILRVALKDLFWVWFFYLITTTGIIVA
jgi:RNA polymerase sigma-70 factor (ECF subfamily)